MMTRLLRVLIAGQEMLLDNSSFRLGHGFQAVMMHPETSVRSSVLRSCISAKVFEFSTSVVIGRVNIIIKLLRPI
jgi:hypothetical protein